MNTPFDGQRGLIVVPVEIAGPTGIAIVRLALDTGATSTVVNAVLLATVGYDPTLAPNRVQVTTGSGIEFAPRVVARKITGLGRSRENFPVLAHTLPPSAGVDGVLGLDFLRDHVLTIDFRVGKLALKR